MTELDQLRDERDETRQELADTLEIVALLTRRIEMLEEREKRQAMRIAKMRWLYGGRA